MQNPLQTFEVNTQGRDFVIGDLHGAYAPFLNLLENIKFDFEKDRMFSVGDLVDRGPQSLECLRLMNEPWFHCVLSNHEQMMLEAFKGGYMGNFWIRNGGIWGFSALEKSGQIMQAKCNNTALPELTDEEAEIIELVKVAEELPFLITVNMPGNKKFHIIHAELPPGKTGITDEDLADPVKVYRLATTQHNNGDSFLWSRWVFAPFNNKNLDANTAKIIRTAYHNVPDNKTPFSDKLSHIISGHTIVQQPVTVRSGQTDIDTCAYGSIGNPDSWCGLTCVNLHDWTFTLTTPTTHKQVQPFVV